MVLADPAAGVALVVVLLRVKQMFLVQHWHMACKSVLIP
jgi:hypothetical protein